MIVLLASTAGAESVGGPAGPAAGGAYGGELPAPPPGPNVTVMTGVPVYTWYHGCGPTALGMMVGYWDAQGFPNLLPGSNDWGANRSAIEDCIASPGHIRDYVPTPDRTPTAGDPLHEADSLADFSGCSYDPLQHGWSYFSKQEDGLRLWSGLRGYRGFTSQRTFIQFEVLWTDFEDEIDLGKPVELLVDTDGNGSTDHFITAVGYDNTPGARKYAAYVTWDTELHWFEFERPGGGQRWGVYGATFYQPVPEPATAAFLCAAAVLLLRRKRRHPC